jgi:hypothetical protein
MSFKAAGNNQHYFLIAKHSGHAIGVSSSNKGENLKQFKFDPSNAHLKFQFHYGLHFFWMLLPPWYICIHNSSKDDGAPALQWDWSPNDANLMFQVLPAGDGFYRIKSLNSQKFLDVYGLNTSEGAHVVQHFLTNTDNQLFQIISAPKKGFTKNPKSYVAINEEMRTCIMGMIGFVPEVGGVIKGIVGLFWTEKDKMGDIWNQMKSYVDERIKECLMESRLETLNDMITGITKLMKELDKTSDAKGGRIQQIMDRIVEREPIFMDKPHEVLPYLVGLGTIMLPLRKMKYSNYAELFGKAPEDVVKEENKVFLKESIADYLEAVTKSKTELMNWRMAKIQNAQSTQNSRDSDGVTETWYKTYAKDDYDGWYQEWPYYERDTMGGTRTSGYPDHKRRAEFAVEQRRAQIRAQYEVDIAEMIRPSRFWKYLDPEEPAYVGVKVIKAVGAFGGVDASTVFVGKSDKKITKIIIQSNSGGNICGLEVFYNNDTTSDGLKGKTGNTQEVLELNDGDCIVSAYGFAKDVVEALYFITKKGIVKGGGTFSNRSSQHAFTADITDGFNPCLANISGAYSHDLQQLTFHWEYID